MANKSFGAISILLAGGLVAAAGCVPASTQTAESSASEPVVQRRCTTVALVSENSSLPLRLIQPYLQQRTDFQASSLVLTDEPTSADATVTLARSGGRDTSIEVSNRITGRHVSAISDWTDYPGMVALSIMGQLRSVCPGSIVAAPKDRPAPRVCAPVPALRSLGSISACSHTSWMDDGEIYDALRTNGELRESSIRLLPACSSADATLEITHNLEQILEWNWKLVSAQRATISSGRVIAFASRDAADRIKDQLASEIALARGSSADIVQNGLQGGKDNVSIRNIRSHLMSSDFSLQDSRVSLSIDNERIMGLNAANKIVFGFPQEDLLDVQRRKEWNHPLQLPEPVGLVQLLETAATPDEAITGTAVLAVYAGVGAVLTQVRTPVHILDLAWREDGAVKTVSIQVPVHESGRLLRALRSARFAQEEQACSTSLVATSQR